VEPYVPLFHREMDTSSPRSILSLEGGEALGREIENVRILYRLGVRQIGLTWNHANLLADGCMEEHNGGLTRFGRECVEEMVRLGMVVDVSHLSERSVWDVVEIPGVKLVASHSNTQAYCEHPRNLTDEQIKTIIACKGLICITFVPGFVYRPGKDARLHHLLQHIDHIVHLGGEQHLAFGSDFDGIETKIPQLETTDDLTSFSQFLLHYFPEKSVTSWCYTNAYKFYQQVFV
jgi:membrane dipeptidase